MDAVTQYAFAYALTTSAGVRGLLALAAMSVAANWAFIHPTGAFAWLGTPQVMWVLTGVALLEILGDKVPFVDHALHFVQLAIKPAAAAILVGGSVHTQSHAVLAGLMVLGAFNALGIHFGIASVRGASTVATAGLANPAISVAEDAGTIASVTLAFIVPWLAAVLAIGFTVALAFLGRAAYRRFQGARR